MALAVSACANPQGYAGPRQTPDRVARVLGKVEPADFATASTFGVSIVKINGATEFEGWTAPSHTVDLLPDTYELDLLADFQGVELFWLVVDWLNDDHHRHVELAVAAGHAYFSEFDRDDDYFLMKVVASSQVGKTRFPDRDSAGRCKLALTEQDREICREKGLIRRDGAPPTPERRPGEWRKLD